MTNWHVLTGRRPDDPGKLLADAPQSPHAISVSFPSATSGHFLPPVTYELYERDQPIWSEYRRAKGVDVAGFPIELPENAAGTVVNDFTDQIEPMMEPGMDLIMVGFPFKQGSDVPYPIWKRGMLANEPKFTVFGNPQMFIDTPGTPGMSGSPVFQPSSALALGGQSAEALSSHERGEISALDAITKMDARDFKGSTIKLEFVGIYAGSTSDPRLERLQLGRMYPASAVRLIVSGRGEKGQNPFPPTKIS